MKDDEIKFEDLSEDEIWEVMERAPHPVVTMIINKAASYFPEDRKKQKIFVKCAWVMTDNLDGLFKEENALEIAERYGVRDAMQIEIDAAKKGQPSIFLHTRPIDLLIDALLLSLLDSLFGKRGE